MMSLMLVRCVKRVTLSGIMIQLCLNVGYYGILELHVHAIRVHVLHVHAIRVHVLHVQEVGYKSLMFT